MECPNVQPSFFDSIPSSFCVASESGEQTRKDERQPPQPPPLSLRPRFPQLSLRLATARSRWRCPRVRVVHRRCGDAAPVEEAAERAQRVVPRGVAPRLRTRRPELLGDGGEAGPNRLLKVGRVDRLPPHLAVAAEDERAELVRNAVARLLGVDSGGVDVEVVEV